MRKTRTGNSRRPAFAVPLALLLLAAVSMAGAPAPKRKKKQPAEYALVAGTVFRENGLSLPGAEVEIEAAGAAAGFKFKKETAVSDGRGEFAFRVPPQEMKYRVSAKARGYAPQEKEVSVAGFERVDVFFRLDATSQ